MNKLFSTSQEELRKLAFALMGDIVALEI